MDFCLTEIIELFDCLSDGVHATGNPPLEPGRLRSTGVYARRVLWIPTGEVATPTPKIWSAQLTDRNPPRKNAA